ncbi:hypothetical protein [Mucilaginibacter sp. AK015]|uniref:hypothetical protein n=1 Tax=Mucilaginibacter sp. AK015 TaxID=2723072 RepID=UPI001620E51A|nr:hypothetical protein [Mucilaginibacter sp. AK015]MBB5395144.1 hypothetical protein [Mucilaginibacter sp. AK015]
MKAHHNYTIPCGLLLICICLLIRYQIGRRRFNRRGIGGLQQFSSYHRAFATSFFERLVLFMGNLCGLAGLLLLALAGINHFKF